MSDVENVRQLLLNGLRGRGSHVSPETAFEGLDWALVSALPAGSSHSIWQLLHHMVYWQEFSLALLRDETPYNPLHASETWTEAVGPTDEREWNTLLGAFLQGVEDVATFVDDANQLVVARKTRSRAEVIGMLIGHNSYHLGQVVLLRQMLGTWPPASGGDTW